MTDKELDDKVKLGFWKGWWGQRNELRAKKAEAEIVRLKETQTKMVNTIEHFSKLAGDRGDSINEAIKLIAFGADWKIGLVELAKQVKTRFDNGEQNTADWCDRAVEAENCIRKWREHHMVPIGKKHTLWCGSWFSGAEECTCGGSLLEDKS